MTENFGETTEAVTEQVNDPAQPVEETPDASQAAQPVEGTRNEDLPLEGGPAEEPVESGDDSSESSDNS